MANSGTSILRVFKNTSLYGVGNLVPQLTNFILLPIYTTSLTPNDFGIISSMQVVQFVFTILFTLGAERSLYRMYYDYDGDDRAKYVGNVVFLIILSMTISTVCIFVFSNLVSKIFISIEFYPYILYTFFSTLLTALFVVPKILLQVKEQAAWFVGINILEFISVTALIFFFVVIETQGAEGYIKGNLMGLLVIAPIYLVYYIKTISIKPSLPIIRKILIFSLPLIPGLISSWVLSLSDRIFIERYFSLSEVGIYSLGQKIANIAIIVGSALGASFNPFFYRVANETPTTAKLAQLGEGMNLIILLYLTLVFCIALFANMVVRFFFDVRYSDASSIIIIYCLSNFIVFVSGIFNLFFFQKKRTVNLMIFSLFSAGINLTLNFVLIPAFSIYGAAISTVISFGVLLIVQYAFVRKIIFVRLLLFKILLLAFTASLMVVISLAINGNSFLIEISQKFVLLIVYCTFLYVLFSNIIKENLRLIFPVKGEKI